MNAAADADRESSQRDAESALDLAYSDRRRARALAERVRRRPDAGPEALAVAEHALGLVALGGGDLGGAGRRLRAAIGVAGRAGLAATAAEARGTLAYVLTLNGETTQALREIEKAEPALRGAPAVRLVMQRALILTEIGRLGEAAADFERALRALRRVGGDGMIEGDIRTNRSSLHARTRNWRAAEDDLDRAEALYSATGHLGRIAIVQHNRGFVAVIRGDLPAALACYDDAERRYREQGRDPGLLPVERAEALLSVRLVTEARAAAEVAVEQFVRQGNAVDLVQARLLLADAALAGGDPATARSEAERARRSAARQQRPGWAALGSHVALRARWDEGDRSDAMLGAGRRTIAALDAAGSVVAALDARLLVGRLCLETGRTRSARRLLADAARARRHGPAELRARAWHAEALLRLSAGDGGGAASALRAGMGVLDRFRASLGASELRAHASSSGADLALLGVEQSIRSGDPASVLRWAERWRAGAMLVRPARPPDDDELALELAELRQVVAGAAAAAADGRDARPLLRRQGSLEEAIRRRSLRAPGARGDPGPVPTMERLRHALGRSTLVEYVLVGADLHAVVVGTRRLRLCRLGPAEPVERALAGLGHGLRRLAHGFGTAASLDAAEELVDAKARLLDDLLLDPLGHDIGDGALVVVPTGALHAVPWAVLASCSGRAVSVAPSARLWHRAATAGTATSGRRVLAAGPGLPHATTEVAALARRYPGALRFTGRRAQVGAVAAALDGADLAHIAAHGRFRADNPLFSSILLADGPLTVYDLERLGRAPRHVVLSACESGLPGVRPGDELLGLAAALLSMGTLSLVAAVVPVPDVASRHLMVRFHRHLQHGLGPAAALAVAQQEMSRDAPAPARAAAAGFVCFGAG